MSPTFIILFFCAVMGGRKKVGNREIFLTTRKKQEREGGLGGRATPNLQIKISTLRTKQK